MSRKTRAGFILLILMIFAACGAGCSLRENTPSSDKLKIVTTIFPPYDFARTIAGDSGACEITMLIKPGAESHSFEPSVQDMLKIEQCDILLCAGGDTDAWIGEEILPSINTENKIVLYMTDMVDLLSEEHDLREDHDLLADQDLRKNRDFREEYGLREAQDLRKAQNFREEYDLLADQDLRKGQNFRKDQDFRGNQDFRKGQDFREENDHQDGHFLHQDDHRDGHVWTSPENAIVIMENICGAMCEADPENAVQYKGNAAAYKEKLQELDDGFKTTIAGATRKTIVVADRFPFLYLTERYGLQYYAAFSGCTVSMEPSLKTINTLVTAVKEERIPVVFSIEFSDGETANAICRATGAKRLLLHSCHNVSREDFENGVTYLDLMIQNLDNLTEALYE